MNYLLGDSFFDGIARQTGKNCELANREVCPTFPRAARKFGLVSNQDEEAEIWLHDATEPNRRPADIRVILVQTGDYGTSREHLESHFLARMAHDGDTVDLNVATVVNRIKDDPLLLP
jgi:hypothetical protein